MRALALLLFLAGLSAAHCAEAQTYPLSSQVQTLNGGGMAVGTATAQALVDVRSATAGVSTTGINIGTAAIAETGVLLQATSNTNSYNQFLIQNTNAGNAASANFVVNNDKGTATNYYGNFGINSSTFAGTGSLSLPNATYLYAQNGELVLGTGTANGIHLTVNGGATDAIAIGTGGAVSIGTSASNASAQGKIACFTSAGALGYATAAPGLGGAVACTGL